MKIVIDHMWDGTPVPPEAHVRVDVTLGDHLMMEVDAPFYGDPDPGVPPGTVDGLWAHEVVELFLVGQGPNYTEIELGPYGHVLVLQLRGVRRRIATVLGYLPKTEICGDRWRGCLELPLHLLPRPIRRVAAFAIHGVGDQRVYLSNPPLPGNYPDFHQPNRFSPWPHDPA